MIANLPAGAAVRLQLNGLLTSTTLSMTIPGAVLTIIRLS